MKSLNEIIDENKKAGVNPDACSICKADLRYTADKHKVQGLWFCDKCYIKNTATKIKLDEKITVTQGNCNSTLVIAQGDKKIKFTTSVLRIMLEKHNDKSNWVWDINNKILQFLQETK